MKLTCSLAKRSLTQNKRRTVITIAGIALSALLLVSIALLTSMVQKNIIKSAIRQNGNWQAAFKFIDTPDAQKIKQLYKQENRIRQRKPDPFRCRNKSF